MEILFTLHFRNFYPAEFYLKTRKFKKYETTSLSYLFLISDFRRVLNIVCILLGISPASDCSLPTFRNPLSVPSSDRGFRNVGKLQSDGGEIPKRIHTIILLSFSPTYAFIYIIKILSQAVTLIALFTPTCFDPYGSSSGSTAGPC